VRKFSLSRHSFICILNGFLIVVMFALAACSEEQADVPTVPATVASEATYQVTTNTSLIFEESTSPVVSIREFLPVLLASAPNAADAIGGRINIPSIWVFSPQGTMTRMVSGMNELESFSANFQTDESKLSSITCQLVESTLRSVSQSEWDVGCGNNQWIALLLVNKDRFDTCNSCQEYQSVLEQIKENNAAVFQAHILPLEVN